MTEPATTPARYTAAQIAVALGASRQVIGQRLAGIPASDQVIVRGNLTGAWEFDALPQPVRNDLAAVVQDRGCRTAAELLSDPPERWNPAVPLSECADDAVRKAVNLHKALSTALARRNDPTLGRAEWDAIGLEDYRRIFGHPISAGHWHRLIDRTLDRAGSDANLDGLDLYLDERPARKKIAEPVRNDGGKIQNLQRTVAGCRNPAALSALEKQAVWLAALETFDARVELGESPKTVKEELFAFLAAHTRLAFNRNALRVSFQRKYDRWKAREREAGAFKDGRIENNLSRRKEFSEEDRDILIAHTVLACGGRVSQGVRECLERRWVSEELLSRIIHNPASKSYAPTWLRDRVRHEVAMLEDNHHGPRRAKLNGAHISRYWGCVPALDWYCMDDATLPIYFYVPDGQGWFTLMRGQFLLAIDTRSTCVLGFALMPERNYNARVIRTLITRVSDEYGLPRRGFYFENGIWKDSRILTGDPNVTPFSWQETEQGLKEFGLRFVHSRLPRSKPVERVLGALQDMMEGDPGYAGRDEVHDGFERFKKLKLQVESEKLDPRGQFCDLEQWETRLGELCSQYNGDRQQGKMTGGFSPEDALEQFRDKNNPGIRFDASCRYLLSHHKRPIQVTHNGITLRLGKQVYNYRSEETGRLRGQMVLGWFNPECPEILAVTDMNRRNPFCVERSQEVPAMDAPDEILAQEMSRIEDHMRYARTRYRVLKSKYDQKFRPNLLDRHTAELGKQFDQQRTALKVSSQRTQVRKSTARSRAQKLGLPWTLVSHGDEYEDEGTRMMTEARRENDRLKKQEPAE